MSNLFAVSMPPQRLPQHLRFLHAHDGLSQPPERLCLNCKRSTKSQYKDFCFVCEHEIALSKRLKAKEE